MDDLTIYARMGLQAELDRLDARRAELVALLKQLDDVVEVVPPERPRKRRMSAEGRQRIREAVQRRWAKVRAEEAMVGGPPSTDEADAAGARRKTTVGRRAAGSRKK